MSGPGFTGVIRKLFRDLGIRVPIRRRREPGDRNTIEIGEGFFADLSERQARGDEGLRTSLETFRAGTAPDIEHELRLARTRWLEANGAVASFGCGVVVRVVVPGDDVPPEDDPWGERRKLAEPVTVAVLPDAFVFLREGSILPGSDRVIEAGRFPRRAFVSAHLEDARGNRVVGPGGDVFEPSRPCRLVVTWRRDDGAEDHDAFDFMALSVAEDAAGMFRRFAGPA